MKTGLIKKGFLLGLIFSNYSPFAQTWSTPGRVINPNIGTGGNIGQYSQLLVVNGNPAIAYFDANHADLVYVRATDPLGTAWGTPITVDAKEYCGLNISLQIVNGKPAIIYYDISDRVTGGPRADLTYVRAADSSGTTWDNPVILDTNSTAGNYTSLQIINGNPAVSYCDVSSGLKYIRANDASGTSWSTPVTIDATGYEGRYNCLQIVNGNPAICYQGYGSIKYVRASDISGNAWGAPVIVYAMDGIYLSLLVVNGNPAIAYYESGALNLEYVRSTDPSGAAWGVPIVVDAAGGVFPSLQIVEGNPAISYYNAFSGNLNYVSATDKSGMAWDIPVNLDFLPQAGVYTSLQIVNGNPAISYFDEMSSNLKFIRAFNAAGTAWGEPFSFDAKGFAGLSMSLQIVNNNPAISYCDESVKSLEYVRAANPSGTAWALPVTVDTVRAQYISLKIVDGNPAIAYFEVNDSNFNNSLKYVRATDVSGTAWGTPITLDNTGEQGIRDISLQIVNGNPAIAYSDGDGLNLKFIRATNVSGTLWSTPVSVDSGIMANYISLQIVNGNPAIAYNDTYLGVKYIRAIDISGTSWNTPLDINSQGYLHICLEIVNGNPAIAFYDGYKGLKYIRATDLSGTAWAAPVTLDVEYYLRDMSLKVVNGNPAIAYIHDALRVYDLKYFRAIDASGSAWQVPSTLLANDGGDYISMVNTDNGAAIAYYDQSEALPYFISGASGPVPVILRSIKAYQQGNYIAVEWRVQNEKAIKHYEVEKATDATTFTKVAAQIAIGNNHSTVNYSWLDVNTTTGNNFYRIRTTGLDGEIKYSQVIKVTIGKGKANYQVYPNPVAGNTINLQFINQPEGIYNLNVINASGQVIFSKQIYRTNGSSIETIELLGSIKKGHYILEIIAPGERKSSLKIIY